MISIGLDLSINSTGICVYNDKTDEHNYYIITHKLTKKQKEFKHKHLKYILYEKEQPNKADEYREKERKKSANISSIVEQIEIIVQKFNKKGDLVCVIEGISYGSSSSSALADLAGLNHAVRYMLWSNNIPFKIVAPTENKKFAVGNGQADKDVMVAAWKKCQPEMAKIEDLKIDDVADAYFLSHFLEK